MTTVNRADDADLDQMLAAMGREAAPVPDALMARVLADAASVQAAQTPVLPVRAAASGRIGWWQRVTGALGGGGVLAGLGTVAVAGVVLGFVQPAPFADVTAAVWGTNVDVAVELLPGADDFWTEG